MNRGPAGAVALNEALQAALNPTASALVRGARTFRVGDKVMQLRNDYDRNVFNGDVGFVSEHRSGRDVSMTIRFDGREVAFDRRPTWTTCPSRTPAPFTNPREASIPRSSSRFSPPTSSCSRRTCSTLR